jgi:hypothetical protein
MEPIPLRTLATLLSYERLNSDPRFAGTLLLKSSIADTTLIPRIKKLPQNATLSRVIDKATEGIK